jgi:Flp pilus assembly protein TadG
VGKLAYMQVHGDDGFQALEMAIIFPIVVLFLLLAVIATRLSSANNEVLGGARAAARAASLSGSDEAAARAQRAAELTLQGSSLHCVGGPAVDITYVRIGTQRAVQADVRCAVELGDLGFGANKTVSARAEEIVDSLASGS